MFKRSQLAGALGCAAMLAIVGCSANSGVTPTSGATAQQSFKVSPLGPGWIYQDGIVYHTPHYMVTRQMASGQVKPLIPLLTYGGGAVLTKPTAYVIYWGYNTYGDSDNVKPLLTNYLKVMGHSGHNNIYVQYYMKTGSTTTYIKNPRRQLAGVWEDDTNPVPQNPTDLQVAAEAAAGVAHFGYDANASYIVATPHGHSSAGFGTQFCAYHSESMVSGKPVSYTNLPYMPDAGTSCGSNFTTPPSDETAIDEGVTIVEGHEYGESVTDPHPFSGWNSPQGEIGDLCAWTNIQNDPFRTKSYTSQPMADNKTQSCEQSGP